jgi:hypothetical protein
MPGMPEALHTECSGALPGQALQIDAIHRTGIILLLIVVSSYTTMLYESVLQ